jgi:hypothetical protein
MSDVNELLEEAIKETENLNEDEVFLVKDLFKGYVWKSKNTRPFSRLR